MAKVKKFVVRSRPGQRSSEVEITAVTDDGQALELEIGPTSLEVVYDPNDPTGDFGPQLHMTLPSGAFELTHAAPPPNPYAAAAAPAQDAELSARIAAADAAADAARPAFIAATTNIARYAARAADARAAAATNIARVGAAAANVALVGGGGDVEIAWRVRGHVELRPVAAQPPIIAYRPFMVWDVGRPELCLSDADGSHDLSARCTGVGTDATVEEIKGRLAMAALGLAREHGYDPVSVAIEDAKGEE